MEPGRVEPEYDELAEGMLLLDGVGAPSPGRATLLVLADGDGLMEADDEAEGARVRSATLIIAGSLVLEGPDIACNGSYMP